MKRLVVLGTGGTIAGRAARAVDVLSYRAGEVPVADLLAGLALPPGHDVVCEQIAQVDSKDMGPEVWRRLLARAQHHLAQSNVAGLVVTHGTDTLEETAYLLQRVLAPDKPVVLVGAMRPASAQCPDGPQNLADALVVATAPGARGVVAVLAGQVHGALDIQKTHPHRLDAFSSGDAGALGVVEAGRFTPWRPWPKTEPEPELLPRLLLGLWPRVEWVTSHAGAGGDLVRALLLQRRWDVAAATGGAPILQGLVVAGTGNATVHADLAAALCEATAAGVQVWCCSRCPQGRVLATDAADGLLRVSLSPAKARLALTLDLLSRG